MNKACFLIAFSTFLVLQPGASAEGRPFTYIYEPKTAEVGELEFEQWVTLESGRKGGDYDRWGFREEIEYGITEDLGTSLYLNFSDTRSHGFEDENNFHDFDFQGVSSEWIYKLLDPEKAAVGVALYLEGATDGVDHGLEGKLLIGQSYGRWTFAFNSNYEMEWEKEDGNREKEAEAELLIGASYLLSNDWSLGLEGRNKRAFPGGLDLKGQEYSIWSLGPVLHYSAEEWWATLTVLPQVYGSGDGASGSIQAVHEERMEIRLIFGVEFS